jgi:hypothetical protein
MADLYSKFIYLNIIPICIPWRKQESADFVYAEMQRFISLISAHIMGYVGRQGMCFGAPYTSPFVKYLVLVIGV